MPAGHTPVFRLLGGDFEVFRPAGIMCCNDVDKICRGAPRQITAPSVYGWGCGTPKTGIFTHFGI